MSLRVRHIPTPEGMARAHLHRPPWRRATALGPGTLLLGHGAGAGVESADLQALTTLTRTGWSVALLEQPWRVAGRRVAGAPATLDRATLAMLQALDTGRWRLPRPWVLGGRSAGARVACRLSHAVGVTDLPAEAVLAVAFPLEPPGRPGHSRAHELGHPMRHGIPMLVLQGARDPFGDPNRVRAVLDGQGGRAQVQAISGDHSPTKDTAGLVRATSAFLEPLAAEWRMRSGHALP